MEKFSILVRDSHAPWKIWAQSTDQAVLIRALKNIPHGTPLKLVRTIVKRILSRPCSPYIKEAVAKNMPLGIFNWALYARYWQRIKLDCMNSAIWFDMASKSKTLKDLGIATKYLDRVEGTDWSEFGPEKALPFCSLLYKARTCRRALALIKGKGEEKQRCEFVVSKWYQHLMFIYKDTVPPTVFLELVQENAKFIQFAGYIYYFNDCRDIPNWAFQYSKYWALEPEKAAHIAASLAIKVKRLAYLKSSSNSSMAGEHIPFNGTNKTRHSAEEFLPLLDFDMCALVARFCIDNPDAFNIVQTELRARPEGSAYTKFQIAEHVYFHKFGPSAIASNILFYDEPFELENFSDDIVVYLLGHEKSENFPLPYQFLAKHPRFYPSLYIPARPNFSRLFNLAKHLTNEQMCKIDWYWAIVFDIDIPQEFCERFASIPQLAKITRLFTKLEPKCFVEVDRADKCAICLRYFDSSQNDNIEPGDCDFDRKACGHIFHMKCWHESIIECPLCRTRL